MKKPSWATNYFFYKLFDRQDIPYEDLRSIVFSSAEVIDRHLTNGVLVHCGVGVSRSALIVTAYLMIKKGMSLDEAFAHVRAKRPCANPNAGFMAFLSVLDSQLRNERAAFVSAELAKASVDYTNV